MACTARANEDLKRKYEKLKHNTNDARLMFRAHVLSSGVNGINTLRRAFKNTDLDGNGKLCFKEFKHGLHDSGLLQKLDPDQVMKLFEEIDRDGSGAIDMEELFIALRPPMSRHRKELIAMAFKKFDRDGDGMVTINDLKGRYNVSHHPKYKNGQWTEEQCLREFLDSFDLKDKDGIITEEEFMDYYTGLSASIEHDAYFDLMMRSAWKL